MWWILVIIGVGLICGLAFRWWGLLVAPPVVVLISLIWTLIDIGHLSGWGGESGVLGTFVLFSLPALVGVALGALVGGVARTRVS